MFSFLDEMSVVIFKAGYEMREYGPWSNFKTRTGGRNVQWDGDNATFMLKKLSYEERKQRILGTPGIGNNKEEKLIIEIRKERKELGKDTL
ncbi:MAG: hypothetical protein HXX11_23715 [Desulfuromonadales bacterium]|nr:hypothetical protein [Desulfuromonadales bacterium]